MVELGQTSTPQFKRCSCCHIKKPISEFWRNKSMKDEHSAQCIICNKNSNNKYFQSGKGQLNRKKYKCSEKGKNAERRYNESDAGVARDKRYRQSGKAILTERNRYYKLQDKYGCHHNLRDWYPAARLIEALETAPIVEIKL